MTLWQPGVTLDQSEKIVIEAAFKFYRGNKTQTAHALGISIRTLDAKLERYGEDARNEERQRAELQRKRQLQTDRQRGIVRPEAHSAIGFSSGQGVRLESASQIGAQSEVSVSERTQVQEVLPKQTSKSREGRPRQAV